MSEAGTRVRLLVADDDDQQRKLIVDGARRLGYEVVDVADGKSALDVFEEGGAPRIAIIDWVMPGLSGPELCRRIRVSLERPYVYVILLTTKSDIDDLREGLTAGADDYLTKPCHPAEFQARVAVGQRVIEASDHLARTIEELTAANEILAAFSRALAHDLRGTLTTIGGYAHLLSRSAIPGDSKELVEQITRANRRMQTMVDDVLVLETAARGPERALFDVAQVIADAAADVSGVEIVVGDVPSHLVAHRSSIARSFKNLFENASRYAKRSDHDHVTVKVSSEEDDDSWTFLVEDDGPGIPPSERERVFETFERGSNSVETAGTGLGLSIVAACARAHDGKVQVTNGPHGGARFSLQIKKPEMASSSVVA